MKIRQQVYPSDMICSYNMNTVLRKDMLLHEIFSILGIQLILINLCVILFKSDTDKGLFINYFQDKLACLFFTALIEFRNIYTTYKIPFLDTKCT